MTQDRKSFVAWLQAAPMMLIFALFFLLPLVFVTIVSTWDYNEYEMIPALALKQGPEGFLPPRPTEAKIPANLLVHGTTL